MTRGSSPRARRRKDSLGKASGASKRWLGVARLALALASFVLAAGGTSFAQSFQPNATWTNQHGSSLTIQAIAPDGSFTGSFLNRSPGPCDNQRFPVSGWIDGQKVSFTVRWANASADCEAITSWTGYRGRSGVLVRWLFVHFNRNGTPILTTGTDIFR